MSTPKCLPIFKSAPHHSDEESEAYTAASPTPDENLPLPNRKGVKARVTFDYDAEQEDELSLKVGDIVDIHDQEEEGWWEGSLNGKRGVFPSNFVAVISDDEVGGSRTSSLGSKSEIKNIKKDPAPPPQEEDSPNETIESAAEKPKKPMGGPMGFGFALNPADLQKKLKKVDPDQKKPTQKGKKAEPVVNGMGTPMKRNAPPPPKETVKEEPKKTSSEKYIVMFQYDAINDDELNLRVGDIVMVTNKAVCEGWWEGQLRGKTGVFPDNFVQPVPSEESTTKDKPLPKKPMLPPGKGKDIDKPLPVPPSKDSKPQMPSMTQKPPLTEAKKPSLPEGKKPPPPAAKKPAPPQPPRPSKEPKKTSEVNEFPRTSSISRKGPPPQPPKSTETPLPQAPKVAVTAPEKESVNGIPNGDTAFDLDVVRPSEPLQHVNKNRIKGPAKNLPARYSQMIVDEEDSVQEPVPVKKDEPPPPAKSDAAPPWMKEVKRMSVKRSQSPTRVKKYSSQEDLTNKEAKPPAPSPVSVPSSSTSDNKEREKQQDKEVAIVKKEASSAAAAAEAANKAADNLKKDITDLQDKMADMEKRFMKHIKVLTDDLDNERKERANLQIEIDRLKKKVEILEGH